MDNTYGEFQGTELDPSLDFDFDDEEESDLLPILGLAAVFASIVGGLLVLVGRRHQPSAAERMQAALETAGGAASKKGAKAVQTVTDAASDLKLSKLLDDALGKARDLSPNGDLKGTLKDARKQARKAAENERLRDVLKQMQDRVGGASDRVAKAAKDADLGGTASDVSKQAADLAASAGLVKLLHDALDKAAQAGKKAPDVTDAADEARSRLAKVFEKTPLSDFDRDQAGEYLEALKERLDDAIEELRTDIAPKAADAVAGTVVPVAQKVAGRVQDDVLPAAQDAVEKLRSDVIPAAQDRASELADKYEVGPRARKAADAAKTGAISFSDLLKSLAVAIAAKIVDELLPEARDISVKTARKAREDVIPAAADTAGQAAQKVREDILPKVTDAAAQTPDMLGDLLQMARDRANDAFEKAQPVASDTANKASEAAGKAAEAAKARAKELQKAPKGKSRGVVGSAVDATAYVTRETTGILFWLAALVGVILLVFVPERDKQEELWNNVRQFLGEVREMWRDLQGPEYDDI